jgi:outer membrane murein-binding lipoprotein Lpp
MEEPSSIKGKEDQDKLTRCRERLKKQGDELRKKDAQFEEARVTAIKEKNELQTRHLKEVQDLHARVDALSLRCSRAESLMLAAQEEAAIYRQKLNDVTRRQVFPMAAIESKQVASQVVPVKKRKEESPAVSSKKAKTT